MNTNYWSHDLFPNGETNSFLESIKLASSGEINWNEIDVKPYCGKSFSSKIYLQINIFMFRISGWISNKSNISTTGSR
jgi:hypothetical protein